MSKIKTHLKDRHSTEKDAKILIDFLNRMRYRCPFCPDVASRDENTVIVHIFRAHRSVPGFADVKIPFDTIAVKEENKNAFLTKLKSEYSFNSEGKVILKVKDGQELNDSQRYQEI